MVKYRRLLVAATVTGALALAACGGDDSDGTASGGTGTSGGTETSGGAGGAGSLADVCPAKLVIQTDWNPEAEHGGIYQMIGKDGYQVNAGDKIVSGPLMDGDVDTGIDLEIRTGGPAIGYQTVVSQMQADDDITMGYVYTDEAIQNYTILPTVSVMSGLEINPQIIMWDPATYPDVKSIADLKEHDVTIRYFETGAYMRYLVESGIVDKGQLDGSYDGQPAVFVAEQGKIAQQGFASAEPYIYEHEVTNWDKPIAFQLIHDAGWQPYSGPLAVRQSELEELSPCLEKFVPIAQRAQIDFVNDPQPTIDLILELVEKYDTGWVYSQGVADFSVKQMVDLGIIGNGPNDVLGDHDEARVDELIKKALPIYAPTNDVKEDLKASDIVTNQFIDTTIKL